MHFTLVKGYVWMNGQKKVFFYILKTGGFLETFEGLHHGQGPAITLQMGLQSTCMCVFFFFSRAMQCDFRIRGDG